MLNDMGILADSVRYYHDADAFTATNLYHVPHAGSYHCDETYGMQRNYLDICQNTHIIKHNWCQLLFCTIS